MAFPNCDKWQWTLPDSYVDEEGWSNPEHVIEPVEWNTWASLWWLSAPNWTGWFYLYFASPLPATGIGYYWRTEPGQLGTVYVQSEVQSGGIWWYLDDGTTGYPQGGHWEVHDHWHHASYPDEERGWITSMRIRFRMETGMIVLRFYYMRGQECIGLYPQTHYFLA